MATWRESLYRFATAPLRIFSPSARRAARAQLTDEVTGGYRPSSMTPAGHDGAAATPPLARMLQDVPAMESHPRVTSALEYYQSGIANAEFEIEDASSDEVGAFALAEVKRFWTRCLTDAQLAYRWGRLGAEAVYSDADGPLSIDRLQPFAGPDARVLLHRGELWGVRVRGARRNFDLGGAAPDMPAKGFWLAHNRRYNRWYGFPQLYPAWRPWRRLAGRDMAEEIIDGGVFRFAFAPPIGRYPLSETTPNSAWGRGARPLTNRDHMRNLLEEIRHGMTVGLASTRDQYGHYEWDIEFPTSALDVSGLLKYADGLEKAISLGIGVPPELLEASEVGSGYSGRAIPLEAFMVRMQILANAMFEAWWTQIGRPLLWWNFGPEASARLKVADLLKSRMKALAEARRGPQQAGGGLTMPDPSGGGQIPELPGGDGGEFQGPSGRRFARRDDGRVVPTRAPQQFATARGVGEEWPSGRGVGEEWQGPSGRWFTRRDDGRVVPTADPSAGEKAVSRAENAIKESAGRPPAERAAAAAALLSSMRVKDLHELKRRLGLRAGGRKSDLSRKIAERATAIVGDRERWAREARKAGVRPKDVFTTARFLRSHARQWAEQITDVIKDARRSYHAYTGRQLTRNHPAFKSSAGDLTTLEHWDEIAQAVAGRYPGIFDAAAGYEAGGEESAGQRLYDMIAAGTPEVKPRDDWMNEAIEHLRANAGRRDFRPDQEELPF
jgi:hypothetical protein